MQTDETFNKHIVETLKLTDATLYPLGECAIVIEIKAEVPALSTANALKAQSTMVSLQKQLVTQTTIQGIVDIVLGMHNLTVIFNPLISDTQALMQCLAEGYLSAYSRPPTDASGSGKLIELPVVYGGQYGPDLIAVAEHHQCKVETVIEQHVAGDYQVCFMGFQPGFGYLHGLDPSLVTPRKKQPRTQVAAGSVGIAGNQTGVYPSSAPGGWQIIGQLAPNHPRLFDPNRNPANWLNTGDRVKFIAVEP